MVTAVVLVAAGGGTRLGAQRYGVPVPKAFVAAGGATLLEHAAATVAAHPLVRDVVVAAPASLLGETREVLAPVLPHVTVVAGGATRQRSVAAALAALSPDVEVVLVHDVARAFTPPDVLDRVITALADETVAGVVPVLPVSDTVRALDPASGELGRVVDRARLAAVQTPQGFRRAVLDEAHARGAGSEVTDDAALVEALGGRVVAVPGDARAFKVTVPLDLALAEVLAVQARTGGAAPAGGALARDLP